MTKNFMKIVQKLQFTYPDASVKDVQAAGEVFSPQKRASTTSKHEISLLFYFCWKILPFWIREFRIQIWIHWSNWIRIQTGSETLVFWPYAGVLTIVMLLLDRCNESITYTTHGDFTFLDNLEPLLERLGLPLDHNLSIYLQYNKRLPNFPLQKKNAIFTFRQHFLPI